mgnify:CR=1 FL=1
MKKPRRALRYLLIAVASLAVLLGGGPLRGMTPADREAVIERVLDVLIAGLT